MTATDYQLGHRQTPPGVGVATLAADFGDGAVPGPVDPPPTDDLVQAGREMDDAIAKLDTGRYVLRDTDPNVAWTFVGEAARIMGVARARLPKGESPPVEPSPPQPTIRGVAVTYQSHDPARDCYLGYDDAQVQWGKHWGIPYIAPADGVVSLYSFPTPLGAMAADPVYMANHVALFGSGPTICGMQPADLNALGQTLYFVLYVPHAPLNGLKALWFGHSRGNAKLGAVKQGEWFGESWDSGVRFESAGINARASHVHCCASATGNLTMNGDVDGLLAAKAMGWDVRFIGNDGPGPDQYYSGRYCAGRLLSDFTTAGKPLPPMPA